MVENRSLKADLSLNHEVVDEASVQAVSSWESV